MKNNPNWLYMKPEEKKFGHITIFFRILYLKYLKMLLSILYFQKFQFGLKNQKFDLIKTY